MPSLAFCDEYLPAAFHEDCTAKYRLLYRLVIMSAKYCALASRNLICAPFFSFVFWLKGLQ